jgi:peptidoglycan/LPS O-acetylase OafA/YrhL
MYSGEMEANSLIRDPQLDNVRGLAIISVVGVHTAQAASHALVANAHDPSVFDMWALLFAQLGKYGVELFFFLSGVLLAKVYGTESKISLKAYAARRLGRILPLWYMFSLFSFLLYLFFNEGYWKGLLDMTEGGVSGHILIAISAIFFITWAIIPGVATEQRVVGGGWSIESEVAHYALFPIFRKLSSLKLIAVISVSGFLASLNDFLIHSIPALKEIATRLESLSIFTTLPFFLGGLLLVGWDQTVIKKSLTWKYLPFWMMSFTGWVLFLINGVPYGFVYEAVGFVILAFGASYVLGKSRLVSKAMSQVGKFSYFIYFLHFYVVAAFYELQPSISSSVIFLEVSSSPLAFAILHLAYFWIALSLSLALGSFSYKFFELPVLRRIRRIR